MENAAWSEVATIARLALFVGYNSKVPVHNQLFIPEIVHLISLLAGSGPLIMRTTIHGMAVNLIQSLYVSRADDSGAAPKLRQILDEAHTPEVLALFGLSSNGPIGDYSIAEGSHDNLSVDNLEELAKYLLKIILAGAQTTCK